MLLIHVISWHAAAHTFVLLGNMDDEPVRTEAPLHLVSTCTSCWRCAADMPLVAILAPNVNGAQGEPRILSNIPELPKSVVSYVRQRFPTFHLRDSKALGDGATPTSARSAA